MASSAGAGLHVTVTAAPAEHFPEQSSWTYVLMVQDWL